MESKQPELNCEHIGSWTVEVGEMDQALHLWQFNGSYAGIDYAQATLSQDEVCILIP